MIAMGRRRGFLERIDEEDEITKRQPKWCLILRRICVEVAIEQGWIDEWKKEGSVPKDWDPEEWRRKRRD